MEEKSKNFVYCTVYCVLCTACMFFVYCCYKVPVYGLPLLFLYPVVLYLCYLLLQGSCLLLPCPPPLLFLYPVGSVIFFILANFILTKFILTFFILTFFILTFFTLTFFTLINFILSFFICYILYTVYSLY